MRDNIWLKTKLDEVWQKYFSDVPKLNTVNVRFGRKAARRLASIRQMKRDSKHSDTQITVTAFYKEAEVPEQIVEVTLAHELCHYAHGFASPLAQFSKYPHRGDIVDSELIKRGLGQHLTFQEKWLKENWNRIVGKRVYRRRPVRRRRIASHQNGFARLIKSLGF